MNEHTGSISAGLRNVTLWFLLRFVRHFLFSMPFCGFLCKTFLYELQRILLHKIDAGKYPESEKKCEALNLWRFSLMT